MGKLTIALIIATAVWNLFVFILYGVDKFKAKRHKWRISEAMLIVPSFFFASLGAMLGMIVFNHKTSKTKFRIFIPLSFLVNIAELYAIFRLIITY
jgi:uncharacterized membrane protein YsdA (DUF1294 family)